MAEYGDMVAEYTREFEGWDWDAIKEDALKEPHQFEDGYVGSVYLGSVMDLTPSGKVYAPFANSNVDEAEAEQDEAWNEALDAVAGEHGMWLDNGEGDPTDLFICIDADEYYKDQARNPETRHPALPEDWPEPKEAGKMEKKAGYLEDDTVFGVIGQVIGEYVSDLILQDEDVEPEEMERYLEPGTSDLGDACYDQFMALVEEEEARILEVAEETAREYLEQAQNISGPKEAGRMEKKADMGESNVCPECGADLGAKNAISFWTNGESGYGGHIPYDQPDPGALEFINDEEGTHDSILLDHIQCNACDTIFYSSDEAMGDVGFWLRTAK